MDSIYTVDRKISAVKIFRRRSILTKIKHVKYFVQHILTIPILDAKVWRRNLDYAKNLQVKYFTNDNIPIYGSGLRGTVGSSNLPIFGSAHCFWRCEKKCRNSCPICCFRTRFNIYNFPLILQEPDSDVVEHHGKFNVIHIIPVDR